MTISKERVFELANEIWDADKWAGPAEARLQRFAQAIRNEALGEAARVSAIHSKYPVENEYDKGYSQARKDAADAIRNLKEQQ